MRGGIGCRDVRAGAGRRACDAPAETVIRVLIVDDHAMFASSLAAVLGQEPDICVVGTACDLDSARTRLLEGPVDVLLLDQHLPDGSGVTAIPELKRLSPSTKIVVLTASADDASLVAAAEAGCAGFLEKSRSIEDLVVAVRAAAEAPLSPELLTRLMDRMHHAQHGAGYDLTARELDVLALVAEGLSNGDIGQRLVVSVNTVRNHVANILAKLGAHSKLEALAIAVREDLLPRGGGA